MRRVAAQLSVATVLCALSGIAPATVLFNPTNTGSTVHLDNLDEQCLGFLCSNISLNFLLHDLDGDSNELNLNDSWTFDFFDAKVSGFGVAGVGLTAALAFLQPRGESTHTGSGIFGTIGGVFSGGYLRWDGPKIVNVDGTSFSVALSDVSALGIGDTTTVMATVKLLENGVPVEVPEPGVLTLLGAGLLCLGLARRDRTQASSRT